MYTYRGVHKNGLLSVDTLFISSLPIYLSAHNQLRERFSGNQQYMLNIITRSLLHYNVVKANSDVTPWRANTEENIHLQFGKKDPEFNDFCCYS